MMAFFDERTKVGRNRMRRCGLPALQRHIALVERNIVRLSTTFEAEHVAGQLDDRAAAHDASKWSAEECGLRGFVCRVHVITRTAGILATCI